VSSSRADRHQSLLSGNKLKLAVFGANVSGGCAMTSAAGTVKPETRANFICFYQTTQGGWMPAGACPELVEGRA
jgi:hypothetical protein